MVAWAGGAAAQDTPAAFSCTFATGTTLTYDDGAFKRAEAAPLAFEITAINLETLLASMVMAGRTDAGPLRVVRAINANHFMEAATEGFLNLTTVYARDPKSGTYPAVHSRHLGVLGQPVIAQYAGTCRAK